MASKFYTNALGKLWSGGVDLDTDDIRVLLVMTNTTGDTEVDSDFIADIGTLDECDGANYVRKALAGEAVNIDDVNLRAEFDANDVTWTALGNGTRQIQGAIVYKFVTNDADSIPIAFVEFSSTVNPGGADFTITWNAEGILQSTAP